MASYVYNPSKKISELLSQYLEVSSEDPQQKISVWSGRVSLSDIKIRTSAINAHLQKYGWKLQSGSIASLEITIPLWKQLMQNKNLDTAARSHISIRGVELRCTVAPEEEAVSSSSSSPADPSPPPRRRQDHADRRSKQKWIQEAERRRLAGLPIASWRARLERQQEATPRGEATPDSMVQSLRGRESRLLLWIKQWTQDLLYQLFLGLTVQIEDMRVILVLPSPSNATTTMESGLVIPSLTLTNPATDPTRLHKHIRMPGLGLYLKRRISEEKATPPGPNDFVLCPVDSDLQVTLLFAADAAPKATVVSFASTTSSTSIPEEKRHRGKREKDSSTERGGEEPPTEPAVVVDIEPPSLLRARTLGAPLTSRKRSFYGASASVDVHRGRTHLRRNSTLSGVLPRKNSLPLGDGTTMGLPLAQPDDLRAHFQNTQQADPSIQLEGKLYMGVVQFRCTSSQYRWLNQALVAGRHIRHGRPVTSIRSVIQQRQENAILGESSSLEEKEEEPSYHPVIGSWWRYALRRVVRELRERQRTRDLFHKLFMSFNWQQQSYGRSEYVRLFIACRLSHRRSADEERLLVLEDELPVEQIVLYRSIARMAHVRGLDAMPPSILDLQSKDARVADVIPAPLAAPKEDNGVAAAATDPSHLLSLLESRGEVARARMQSTGPSLPEYPALVAAPASVEEVSFAAHTNRSNTSRRGVAGTMIDHMSSKKNKPPRMMYSFSIQVQKLEWILVDDDDRMVMESMDENSRVDSASVDISVLTEEDLFVPEDRELRLDESMTMDPLNYAASEYCLLDLPQRVLLHIQISSLESSLLGDSEKSRCFSFRVGQVKATGDNSFEFLSVGSLPPTGLSSMGEFMLAVDDSYHSVTSSGRESRNDALFVSLVISNHHNFLQCDTPTIRTSLEPSTLGKITSFLAKDAAQMPLPLLERSPREHVRLYVLQEQNQKKYFNMNCSIRVQGFEFHLCAPPPSVATSVSSASLAEWNVSAAVVRCSMIEIYSGSAVSELSASLEERQQFVPLETQTRQLCMLDLTATNPSVLSFHWVFAVNGVDVVLSPASANPMSLLRETVSLEAMYSINSNSLLDFNHSKQEVVLEVSPIHLILSEECIVDLSKLDFQKYLQLSSQEGMDERKKPPLLPPRLDVLSSYMRFQLNLSVKGMRCSILSETNQMSNPSARKRALEGAMMDFLRVASLYDLRFPHEAALDAAMQICVDRLVGVGLSVDAAFEAVNRALLKFLDEVADEPTVTTESPVSPSGKVEYDEQLKRRIIEKVAMLVSACYTEYVEQGSSLFSVPTFDLDIDFSGGLQLNWMSLFYDQHISIHVPSVSFVNGEGFRLFVIDQHEIFEPSRSGVSNTSDILAQSEVASIGSPSTPYGVTLHSFSMDKGHPFGRGGLPLSILGADVNVPETEFRIRERFTDLDLGDIEFTFSRPIVDDIMESLCRVFAPFLLRLPSTDEGDKNIVENRSVVTTTDVFFLTKLTSITSLFLSDDLTPFLLLSAALFVVKSERRVSLCGAEEDALRTSCFTGRSIGLMNLTCDGELFPNVISVLPSHKTDCVFATFEPSAGIDVTVQGLRVFFLKQFLSEILQYFVSGQYGFSRLLHERVFTEIRADSGRRRPKQKQVVSFKDMSIIIPRSCGSYDAMCVEMSSASFLFCETASSFSLPSSVVPFNCDDIPFCDTEPSASSCEGLKQPISRIRIRLIGFRIFSCLPEEMESDISMRDSPSFQSFFTVDGRAEDGKLIFCPCIEKNKISDNVLLNDSTIDEKAFRRWCEITTDVTSLEIIVDRAPHLRLLIFENFSDRCSNGLSLDMRLPQFCLLLSIWFSNCQELPQLFPYSVLQLQKGVKPLEVLSSIPDYGSESFREFLKVNTCLTSEVAVVLQSLSLRCSSENKTLLVNDANKPGLIVGFRDVVAHVTNDKHGVARIGVGSSSASFIDESLLFSSVLSFENDDISASWADIGFGLDRIHMLPSSLPQSFQLSIVMAPGWQIYNLGLNAPRVTLSDLSPIFKFLKFVSAYFSDARLGNPSLMAVEHVKRIKTDIKRQSMGGHVPDSEFFTPKVSSLDFRLWLAKPFLSLPCIPLDKFGPGLRIEGEGGFCYQYLSIGEFSSQQCASDCLHLSFDKSIQLQSRDLVKGCSDNRLVENLSFGFRLDSNTVTDHTDVMVQIPFDSRNACDLCSPRFHLAPVIFSPPIICSPHEKLTRSLGPSVCEITCLFEVLPLTLSTFVNFLSGDDVETDSNVSDFSDENAKRFSTLGNEKFDATKSEFSMNRNTLSLVALVGDSRFFVLDPVLGSYLPLAVLSISSLSITASYFANEREEFYLNSDGVPSDDMQISVSCHAWADYFKLGLTRSWEPLIEAYKFRCEFEKSRNRGSGLSLNSDSRLHVNISSALLVALDEVVSDFLRTISQTFSNDPTVPNHMDKSSKRQNRDENALTDSLFGVNVTHKRSETITKEERVAFHLRNLTGQKMRVFRPFEFVGARNNTQNVTYLDNSEATELSFPPCISVVKNLKVTEIAYPGYLNGTKKVQGDFSQHLIDVQVTGFQWLEAIEVDTFGRKFSKIVPLSQEVRLKVDDDWRLANMMHLLVEVGLRNGGRQVTVRSVISVTNNTTHGLGLRFDSNPLLKTKERSVDFESERARESHSDLSADFELSSGETLQVPMLLLESSLRHPGSNLGCMWMKPLLQSCDAKKFFSSSVEKMSLQSVDEIMFTYSSRHVPFAKLVKESATLFETARFRHIGPNQAKTKLQLSCPVVRHTGDRLAPFCFAVEIDRSPIVPCREKMPEEKRSHRVHAPVAYSLVVHPPIIIANFLPEKGRFELMHAVNRMVLWSGELEPGQQESVHSVGLDAPLLLFLNLGFAKTPVGEGALVHHGSDLPPSVRDNLMGLKSIGKAGKAVTKKIGKTLISIGESPDRRGLKRMFMAQNPQMQSLQPLNRQSRFKTNVDVDSGEDSDDENLDGKTYKIDNFHYFADDVARQTTIVDSLGQKLLLSLENIRGGGGQRKITVFCRYWILNTTEHCLRYKQENSKFFVTGTVLSPSKDGSLPLSGARSRMTVKYWKDGYNSHVLGSGREPHTIYAGTPGALASSPGRCELPSDQVARLLESNLSVEELAKWAFMFNFHEGPVVSIGQQKLCVQLWDGTGKVRYVSDWSRGFGLDSVGVAQTVEIHCKDGRVLELSVIVTVAPGYLSNYTTLVRFLPRYAIVNNLPYQIRLWQDSSIFRPYSTQSNSWETATKWRYGRQKQAKVNQYELLWGRQAVLDDRAMSSDSVGTSANGSALFIGTVFPNEILPFCLPDSRSERQLRVDLGNPWSLSGSISADNHGDFILSINRTSDLKATPHVSTRFNPHYELRLPPHGSEFFDGELGIWFEPDYGIDRCLIVKAIKRNTYAFNETDVHVGDELLMMDGVSLSGMLFADAISLLKSRLSELSSRMQLDARRRSTIVRNSMVHSKYRRPFSVPPVVLTFRTVEERIRKVRQRAADVNDARHHSGMHHIPFERPESGEASPVQNISSFYIHADLKSSLQSSLGSFLVLREEPKAPYEIQNQSIAYTLYYRQRGCLHCCWQVLKPGQSTTYSWEEPLKPKKLIARVALDRLFVITKKRTEKLTASKKRKQPKLFVEDRRKIFEEDLFFSPSVVLPLEEVGYCELLPMSDYMDTDETLPPIKCLKFEVDVEGIARVLSLRDSAEEGIEDETHIARSVDTLQQKLQQEEKRILDLSSLKTSIDAEDEISIEKTFPDRLDSFAQQLDGVISTPFISGCHQIVVEILEARGLNPESVVDLCSPYCDVCLSSKHRHDRKNFLGKADRRKTYFIRKTVSPVWKNQAFVFHVPTHAVSVTHGYSIRLRVRNFRIFGKHQILGRGQVDFHSVRDQEPLTGWFPLVGRTDRRELDSQISHWGRGSIKVRVQWIYTVPALVQYFIMLSEQRRLALTESLSGIEIQELKRLEIETRKRAGIDGLKAVRMEELLSFRKKSKQKLNVDQMQLHRQTVASSVVKTPGKRDPFESRLELTAQSRLDISLEDAVTSLPHLTLPRPLLRLKDASRNVSLHNMHDHHGLRKRANSSHNVALDLEDQISQKRLNLHRYNSSRHRLSEATTEKGTFTVPFFRNWNMVQALLNDASFDVEIFDNSIKLNIGSTLSSGYHHTFSSPGSEQESLSAIAKKLCPSHGSPRVICSYTDLKVNQFVQSRKSFERSARISMKTVLHSGGWLSIRPVSALNLPDMYIGMAVKVKYGAETFVSETVDARSLDPSWYKVNPDVDVDDQWDVVSQGDIHLHVAPQKTNGAIRLSVVGEKGHKQLSHSTKQEVGVLYLPLGATISACLDHEENRLTGDREALPMLLRWFPLTTPMDSVKVEGDEGLTTRPPDSEKVSDTDFKEYFAPCIQLAIFWTPEIDAENMTKDDTSQRSYIDVNRTQSSPVSPRMGGQIDFPVVQSYFNADIIWMSVALLDSQRARELLALSLREIDFRYWVTTAKTRVGFSVGWLQLDYQDDDVREPVVLAPTPNDVLLPVIQTLILKDNLRSVTDVISFDFIDVSIAELDFTIEERLLFDLAMFWSSIQTRKGTEMSKQNSTENFVLFEHLFLHPTNEKNKSGTDLFGSLTQENRKSDDKQKVYIKDLVIGVVKINISYLKGKVRDSLVDMPVDRVLRLAGGELLQQFFYKDDDEDFYLAWSQTTFDDEQRVRIEGKASQNLPSFLATLFPNVSDAPLRLPGKSVKHTFESASDIVESIRKFYTTEALKQFYKIVGALDFVGNPTMLVTSFFSGIRDLVVTPHTALMNSPRNPSRLGIGFATGTLSFFSHGLSGFFGYTSKLAAAAGQTVAAISLDTEFRDWHNDKVVVAATNLNREWKRRGVQNIGMMVVRPLVDVTLGVAGGVSGVIISPVKSFKKNGPAGVPLGLAVGGIGFFAKPLVGMMDAVSHFSASIHDIAKSVNVLDRRLQPALKLRLPYVFGWMSILTPFQSNQARAVQLLKTFPAREIYRRTEDISTNECLVHVETLPSMGTEVFVIVTTLRVSLIRVKKEMSGVLTTTLCLEVYFSEDVNISSKVDDFGHNSVALIIYKRDRDKLTRAESKRNGTFFALSPQLAWKTVTWRSMPGLTSPDAATTAGTTILSDPLDVDDATGDEGNLLDKFTVLADYQYRPQLTRLHNAICCVKGDLDALVHVEWGTAGSLASTEGYTSFGIYHFEKNTDVDSIAPSSSAAPLEYLPWVPRKAFDLARDETAEDQKIFLSKLREECNFDTELEQSQYEGGPDWLVLARAMVSLEEKERLASFIRGRTPQISQRKVLRISEEQPEVMPNLEDIEITPGVDSSMPNSLSLYQSAVPIMAMSPSMRDSLPLYKSAFQSSVSPKRDDLVDSIPESLLSANGNDDDITKAVEDGPIVMSNVLTEFRRSSASSGHAASYTTAPTSSTDHAASYTSATAFSRSENAPDPFEESVFILPTDNDDASVAPKAPMVAPEVSDVVVPAADSVEGPRRAESQEKKRDEERRADRLDRMEDILEQLLLFNSEQALQRVQRPANEELEVLRKEVQALRAQLEEIQKKDRGNAALDVD